MPLPIAHALVGASVVAALHKQPGSLRYPIALLLGAFLANAPDLDFFLVFTFHSRAWHRGFSHSLVFAGLICLLFVLSFGTHRVRESIAYGLAFTSHGLLDYVTTKEGGGVELLWPFSMERLIFGWVGLSELPSRLPPLIILRSLAVELAIFAPVFFAVWLWRRSFARQ